MKKSSVMRGLAAMIVFALLPHETVLAHRRIAGSMERSKRQEGTRLEPNLTIEKELAGDVTHSFLVEIESGKCVYAEIDQKGADVRVGVYAPDGRKILDLDSPNGARGTEPVLIAAKTTGVYRLVVSHADDPTRGLYSVRLEEARDMTERDETIIAAQQAFSEAGEMQSKGTARSLRQSIGRYEESFRIYQLVGDRARQSDALYYAGRSHHLLGEPEPSLNFNTRALATTSGDRSREGFILDAIGSAHVGLGDDRKAFEFFNQSLAARRDARDQKWEAITLKHLGLISFDLGEYQKSLDHLNEALSLNRLTGNQQAEASCLGNIAAIYRAMSEGHSALEFYHQALSLNQRTGDRKREAALAQSIGVTYNDLGEYSRALEFFNRALIASRDGGNRRVEANVLNGLSQLYLKTDQPQKAMRMLRKAMNLRQSLGDLIGESVDCREIGKLCLDMGQWPMALRFFNRAIRLGRSAGNKSIEARTLNLVGEAYYHLGETAKAEERFNTMLPLARDSGNRLLESSVLYNLARVERRRGNLDEARAHIEAALEIVNDLRTTFYSPDLRAVYFASVQNCYRFYIDLLMQMRGRDDRLEALALEMSEQSRARSLLDLLNGARASLHRDIDPAMLERERELRLLLNGKIERQLRLLGGVSTAEQKAEVEGEIKQIAAEHKNLLARIRQQNPRYAELTQIRAHSIEEIQRLALDRETLLLEYSLGEERSYLWVVSQDSISSFELRPRAEIEAAARRFYSLLATRPRQSRLSATAREAATQFSRLLLGQAAHLLGSKRLLIVADGALHYISFAALADPATEDERQKTKNKGRMTRGEYRPLVARHDIANLPSASTLVALRSETVKRRQPSKSVAVIADPVFDANDLRVRGARNGSKSFEKPSYRALRSARRGAALSRLPFTREEAENITAAAPTDSSMKTLDFASNRAAVMSDSLAEYRFVHLATHGWLDASHPEMSGIVLSLVDERGEWQEGFLGLGDIYNLDLPVEMITLSACQTGLGREIRGEGIVGLTRGFMYAGARRVMASLWKVDDFATSQLMRRVYERILRRGETPASALASAQREMWQKPQWRHPYFWAAFALQGEWN